MPSPYILVIRLSSMGDVALTVPLVRQAAAGSKVLVITKPIFADFFLNIANVSVLGADTSGRHRGLKGIINLYREIRLSYRIGLVLDLHSVIRSWILSALFRLSGSKVYRIDKGRKAKRRFVATHRKEGLVHTTERYRTVFINAGLAVNDIETPAFQITGEELEKAGDFLAAVKNRGKKLVALAPYAMHLTKQWPEYHMKELILLLGRSNKTHCFLFGSINEKDKLLGLASGSDSASVLAGTFNIREELAIISKMDLMISMDSSNLHLAALSGISTLSIWGGTHPYTGFGPVGSQAHSVLQVPENELGCRPCTVYGKGDCRYKVNRYRCLSAISPAMVISKLKEMGIL